MSTLADLKPAGAPARNYPNFIDAYLEYTKGQEASEKIHRWVAISIIAAALERKVWINRGHYTLFPNLYVFIIGASGIVRKSTSTGIGVDLLRSMEHFSLMSERLTAASLIAQLARSGRKGADYNGENYEHSSVFAYASELSVFLKEVFGSISELLTTFYDCAPNDWRKPWVYETKGDGEIRIHGPCLNILGASTPTWLVSCIPPSEMEGGFSSRVIFVVENDIPKKFIAWPEHSDEIAKMKPKLISDLSRIHAMSGKFKVTPDAKDWFSAWYKEHSISLVRSKDPRFSGYFGRKGDTVLKIAMALSASEGETYLIEKHHIEQAEQMLTTLEANMYDAFGAAGDNTKAKMLKKVWTTIKQHGEITHASLLKIHWRDTSHKELIELCGMLAEMGALKFTAVKNGPKIEKIVYSATDKEVRL